MGRDQWVNAADKAYCRSCRYYPKDKNDYGRYLCEFFLQTGKLRGCPPGRGCTRRVKKKKS